MWLVPRWGARLLLEPWGVGEGGGAGGAGEAGEAGVLPGGRGAAAHREGARQGERGVLHCDDLTSRGGEDLGGGEVEVGGGGKREQH